MIVFLLLYKIIKYITIPINRGTNMNLFKILLISLIIIFPLKAYSFSYSEIDNNSQVVYSPYSGVFTDGGIAEDRIVLTKHSADENNSFPKYTYKDKEIQLNSDFDFLYNEKLYGIDNKNLKYYQITYDKVKFTEKQLSYEQVENAFKGYDVVKISDFKDGMYRILNGYKDKEILLYNDTDKSFKNYSVKPEKFSPDKNINGLIKLPYWGKVIFSPDTKSENQETYTIKIR